MAVIGARPAIHCVNIVAKVTQEHTDINHLICHGDVK